MDIITVQVKCSSDFCDELREEGLILKSVIIKNMEGNRAKRNKEAIWRYRALSSDYYIFKQFQYA
ncbi:hypothetical protein KAU19_02910 [Candidatus Parcubacteria bacterium]|nr:hypothetical protein [Candidatus Parcubacteria bacterium]